MMLWAIDHAADSDLRRGNISGLAGRGDRKREICEVPEHRLAGFGESERLLAAPHAVEHVGVMDGKHRRHEQPGIR